MSTIFLNSLLIFVLICTYTFYFADYRNFTKVLKKYLLSLTEIINLIKSSKKIDINLLKEKLDNITKNGLNLIIQIISISLPFIFSLFLYIT